MRFSTATRGNCYINNVAPDATQVHPGQSVFKARHISRKPDMNAYIEMNPEEVLRVKLEVLRREHRDLDAAIHALAEAGRADQLALVRLKKQKLVLKDRISRLEDELTPDIIA